MAGCTCGGGNNQAQGAYGYFGQAPTIGSSSGGSLFEPYYDTGASTGLYTPPPTDPVKGGKKVSVADWASLAEGIGAAAGGIGQLVASGRRPVGYDAATELEKLKIQQQIAADQSRAGQTNLLIGLGAVGFLSILAVFALQGGGKKKSKRSRRI